MKNELMNIKLENNNIIKSTDLVEIINYFRHEEGKNDLRHDNFYKKIIKELEMMKIPGLSNELNFKKSYYINSQNKKQPCFELNKEAVKYMAEVTKNRDKETLLKVYEYMGGDSSVVYCIDRFETTFFNKLSDTLQAMDIELDTQKNVLGKYRLDGFLPQYNIVIEYDEEQHNVEPQKSKDIKRQKEVEKELGCQFIRLDYRNTDAYNIGLVIKEIINNI